MAQIKASISALETTVQVAVVSIARGRKSSGAIEHKWQGSNGFKTVHLNPPFLLLHRNIECCVLFGKLGLGESGKERLLNSLHLSKSQRFVRCTTSSEPRRLVTALKHDMLAGSL